MRAVYSFRHRPTSATRSHRLASATQQRSNSVAWRVSAVSRTADQTFSAGTTTPESGSRLSHHDGGQACADQPHPAADMPGSRSAATDIPRRSQPDCRVEPEITIGSVPRVPNTDDALWTRGRLSPRQRRKFVFRPYRGGGGSCPRADHAEL
jgi:hypothetical protein